MIRSKEAFDVSAPRRNLEEVFLRTLVPCKSSRGPLIVSSIKFFRSLGGAVLTRGFSVSDLAAARRSIASGSRFECGRVRARQSG